MHTILSDITTDLLTTQVGRRDVIEATWLSILSGKPAFFLGPFGVSKTGTIQKLAGRITGAIFYEALLPMVVSPDQLFVESTMIEEMVTPNGKLIKTVDQLGRAALAHIVFADELWKGEPDVINATLDLSKGDGIRHNGVMIKTPLLSFVGASNELPDPDSHLGAAWSRMTIRALVSPLDRSGKFTMAKSRVAQGNRGNPLTLSLEDLERLREQTRKVEIEDSIINTVLDIYEELLQNTEHDFSWMWNDDRRFGRCLDVLKAQAVYRGGRTKVSTSDLEVLELLLWDVPEHIPVVKGVLAPYIRTPLKDAQEIVDSLLSPQGIVQEVLDGDRSKGVLALTQCEEAMRAVSDLKTAEYQSDFDTLIQELTKVQSEVTTVVLGRNVS